MVDRGQDKTTTTASDLSLKKKELLSSAMKRTSEWYICLCSSKMLWWLLYMSNVLNMLILCLFATFCLIERLNQMNCCCCCLLNYRIFSQEIPSDVKVRVGEASFSIHKVVSLNLMHITIKDGIIASAKSGRLTVILTNQPGY